MMELSQLHPHTPSQICFAWQHLQHQMRPRWDVLPFALSAVHNCHTPVLGLVSSVLALLGVHLNPARQEHSIVLSTFPSRLAVQQQSSTRQAQLT